MHSRRKISLIARTGHSLSTGYAIGPADPRLANHAMNGKRLPNRGSMGLWIARYDQGPGAAQIIGRHRQCRRRMSVDCACRAASR